MRYALERKPRNPYDMIIQENHAAGKAYYQYIRLVADNQVKEV